MTTGVFLSCDLGGREPRYDYIPFDHRKRLRLGDNGVLQRQAHNKVFSKSADGCGVKIV